jgi:hypothetical protein
MSDFGGTPDSAAVKRPEFELVRSRKFDGIVLAVILMVLGWYTGSSLSNLFSVSFARDMVLSILSTGLGAALAAYLVSRLAMFHPVNALILRVSVDGLTLGHPTNQTLIWTEIDRLTLIRSSSGRLPIHHLHVIRTSSGDPGTTRPEITHNLGLLWDRRSLELVNTINAFRQHAQTSPDGQEGVHNSESWTGTRADTASL